MKNIFYIWAALLLLIGTIPMVPANHAIAAANITVGVVVVTGPNTIVVKVSGSAGQNIVSVDPTKFHIDVNTGGVSPLTPTSYVIDEAAFDNGAQFTLTFAGTPFSAADTTYDASHGLYIDASGVTDDIANTNAVIGHASSVPIFDGQIPVLNSVSIASNGPSASYAKVGDVVTLTFEVNEAIGDWSITISGTDVSGTLATVSGTTYAVTRTMLSGDTEGGITFDIGLADNAGNTLAANATATTDFSAVRFDKTAPVISEVTPVTTPTTDETPEYTFTTDEDGTITYGGTCASATTSASSGSNTISFAALPNGTYTNCTITVTDYADNDSNTITVTAFTVNSDAPSVTLTSSESGITHASPVPMTATFSEAVSGFAAGDIAVSGGTVSNFVAVSTTVYTFDVVPSGYGRITVNVPAAVAMDSTTNDNSAAAEFSIAYQKTAGNGSSGLNPDVSEWASSPDGTLLPVSAVCTPYLTESLRRGDRKEPVKTLQAFLKSQNLFAYPELTTFFGPITFQAVMDFQQKYASDILTPISLSAPTGFVGEMTLKKINELSCK